MSKGLQNILSGRLLARNVIWDLVGATAPLLVGLVAIPLLIAGMGKERFGLLTIIWMGVGYFSLFDLGLGRALTKLVADRLGDEQADDFGPLLWTALFLLFLLGTTGSIAVMLSAKPLIQYVLNVDVQLHTEAIRALHMLAMSLPIVVMTTALVGILQAHQRFAAITSVRIPLGILTFAGPLTTLQFSPSLVWATAALVAARTLALAAYFAVAASVRVELKHPIRPRKSYMGPLLRFGGWLTVISIISPLMVYFDRFFIGAILSMTAVAYYVTPYEVLSRIQVIPQSFMSVLFPAMATIIATDHTRLPRLYRQSSLILLLLVLPVASGFFLLGPEGLQVWLGDDFRIAATPVVHWLSLGILVNTLTRPAFWTLQSAGRPDLVAKTHMAEIIPYTFCLWFFTQSFGIAGTAAAWFMRVLADNIILNELIRQRLPELGGIVWRSHIKILGILVGFSLAWIIEPLFIRFFLLAIVIIGSSAFCWPLFIKLYRTAR
ncbi:MAG: flippase [Syntrophaceae bacterium]